jgi:hypothetical protein
LGALTANEERQSATQLSFPRKPAEICAILVCCVLDDENAMADPAEALMVQFLTFLADRGRSYGEVMDAWRTSCPRMTIWEDAVIEGLVQVERTEGATREQSRVTLTAQGRRRLGGEVPDISDRRKHIAA